MPKLKAEKALVELEIQATNLIGHLGGLQPDNFSEIEQIKQQVDAIDTAQKALNEYIAVHNPKPLSKRELRSMIGKPVFEKDLGWYIIWNIDENFVYLGRGDKFSTMCIENVVLYKYEKKGCGKKL